MRVLNFSRASLGHSSALAGGEDQQTCIKYEERIRAVERSPIASTPSLEHSYTQPSAAMPLRWANGRLWRSGLFVLVPELLALRSSSYGSGWALARDGRGSRLAYGLTA